jgi:predicted nucleotidyltransferase
MNTAILEDIRQLKRQLIPDEKIFLFGSQVRGDARPDSDWDLLVLLNKPQKETTDYENYGYPFDEIGFSYGVAISPIIYTNKQWEQRKITPFYKNVMQEGIEIK